MKVVCNAYAVKPKNKMNCFAPHQGPFFKFNTAIYCQRSIQKELLIIKRGASGRNVNNLF